MGADGVISAGMPTASTNVAACTTTPGSSTTSAVGRRLICAGKIVGMLRRNSPAALNLLQLVQRRGWALIPAIMAVLIPAATLIQVVEVPLLPAATMVMEMALFWLDLLAATTKSMISIILILKVVVLLMIVMDHPELILMLRGSLKRTHGNNSWRAICKSFKNYCHKQHHQNRQTVAHSWRFKWHGTMSNVVSNVSQADVCVLPMMIFAMIAMMNGTWCRRRKEPDPGAWILILVHVFLAAWEPATEWSLILVQMGSDSRVASL